jgi:hypothetical protein
MTFYDMIRDLGYDPTDYDVNAMVTDWFNGSLDLDDLEQRLSDYSCAHLTLVTDKGDNNALNN